jgi:hypothetical protein
MLVAVVRRELVPIMGMGELIRMSRSGLPQFTREVVAARVARMATMEATVLDWEEVMEHLVILLMQLLELYLLSRRLALRLRHTAMQVQAVERALQEAMASFKLQLLTFIQPSIALVSTADLP